MNTYGLVPDGMYFVVNGHASSLPMLVVFFVMCIGAVALLLLGWAVGRVGPAAEYRRGLANGYSEGYAHGWNAPRWR